MRHQISEETQNDSPKVRFNRNGKNALVSDAVNVTFLSQANGGKCLLTNAIRSLAKKTLNNEIDVDSIKPDLVDKQIYGMTRRKICRKYNSTKNRNCFADIAHLSEPQLIVCVGMYDTLAGFSPWHIRLSEIMLVKVVLAWVLTLIRLFLFLEGKFPLISWSTKPACLKF